MPTLEQYAPWAPVLAWGPILLGGALGCWVGLRLLDKITNRPRRHP